MSSFLLQADIQEIVQRLGNISDQFCGKRILLTGGRGFLGRYFMEVFKTLNETVLKDPLELIVLDNLITAGKEGAEIPNYKNIKFINHDVIRPFDIENKVDYIIHAAGIASPYYYRAYPLETLEVAITGTRRMLELADKHDARFTFFSSSEIYGDPDPKHVPMSESYRGNVSCQGPRACYDESKRLGETLCYIYHNYFQLHTNIIRPFNIYGPGMNKNDYRMIPNLMRAAKENKSIKVYGDGKQTRTFCYLDDAIEGIIRVICKGNASETFNIGNPNPEVSMNDLVNIFNQTNKLSVKLELCDYPDSYPSDEPLRRCPSIDKAKIQLDYVPKVSLEEGLRETYQWSQKNY